MQCVDGPYDLGELVVAAGEAHRLRRGRFGGEPGRADPYGGERPGQRAGHGGRHGDGDDQAAGGQRGAQLQIAHGVVADLAEALQPVGSEPGLRTPHLVDPGGERGVELGAVGVEVAAGQLGRGGELGEGVLGRLHVGAGHRVREGTAFGGVRRGVEVVERGLFPHVRELGGGAERVAFPALRAVGARPFYRQPGQRVDRGLVDRDGEGGQQQAAGGGRLPGGAVEGRLRAHAGCRVRGRAVAERLGEPLQRGDDRGVRGVRGDRGALAGHGGAPDRGNGAEVLQGSGEGGGDGGSGEYGADLGDLPVDHVPRGAEAVVVPALVPGVVRAAGVDAVLGGLGAAARRDEDDDLVALVGQGMGEGDGLAVEPGEGEELLSVVEAGRGLQKSRRAGCHHDDAGDHDTGDEPCAYPLTAPHRSAVVHTAVPPRPLLLHRCSHSRLVRP
jgi:hypothetical protein